MTIRPYTAADKENVLHLLRLNTPRYFAPSEEKDLVHYLDHHAQHYFVVESGGEVLGCGGFNFSDDRTVGKISWDIFHPGHQGKGLGSALTRYRIEKLKEYDSVRTISVRTSQVAYLFYEKFGFRLREVVKDYWAEGFDLYRMEFPVEGGAESRVPAQ
jgi:ribosomal protein S18 acetylase RimI-like enzyme